MDIRTALKDGIARLRTAGIPSYTLAAELLLMHSLGRDRVWLYTNPEAQIESGATDKYFALLARRVAGEPTQYLTCKQEFWGLELEVGPAVLIPRPETEHIIEVALDRLGMRGLKIRLDTGEPSAPLRIADVGTGSGCLAIALAWELPHAEIIATDTSPAAIEIARRNAARHGVADRIHFIEANLLEVSPSHTGALPLLFDLIVSNPPYIGSSEAGMLPREVREHEPHAALFGGPSGVELYSDLISQAGTRLRVSGILVLELGYNSVDHVRALVAAHPRWREVSVTNDLAGIPRVLSSRFL